MGYTHCLRDAGITESVHVPNANVVDISRVAGHKDLKTTLGYIHVADDRLHQTVANLPKLVKLLGTLKKWQRWECQKTSRKLAPRARLELATYGLTVQ